MERAKSETATADRARDAGVQKIILFQQNGRAQPKITGMNKYGEGRILLEVVSIDVPLPSILDDTDDYLPADIQADMVLDFLGHPDLSGDLARMCAARGIPVVASGKKHRIPGVYTPPTWCGLSRQDCLGYYGDRFGAPEFIVEVADGKIVRVEVLRGAPCGASWEAAKRIVGYPVEEVPVRIGLETQFFCSADPAGWDPIYGKSPVHFAGEIHKAALRKALESAKP